MPSAVQRICVYCASSTKADSEYVGSARRLGEILARRRVTIVYGGGSVGSMGALADGALGQGGRVVGVLPSFMHDLEWGHTGLSELRIVNDLHERKRLMISETDAVVALPGGSGTLEELLEVLTWKRLGLFFRPIVIVNTRGYYEPLRQLLDSAIDERFMDPRHRDMWSLVDRVEDVLPAIENSPHWDSNARSFASL